MVSSQMHWSLVIQRTEESIRFSLELNWINLSRFSSRTSLPIWEKNGQAVHVHVQYPVFYFFSHGSGPFWIFVLLQRKTYTCIAGVMGFFSLSFFPNIDLVQISLPLTCCYYHKLYCRNGVSQVMVSVCQTYS